MDDGRSSSDPPGQNDRLAALLDFLITADRLKGVERRAFVGDGSRRENSAEHSWHLALAALVLHREVGFTADLGRTLALALVHDLVEIHAGDTYAYDEAQAMAQAEREEAAAHRLFDPLPADLRDDLWSMWREFERGETAEARLAKACDRLQGFLQNYVAGGLSWRENGISRERTYLRTELPRSTDPALCALVDLIYARADAEGLWPT
jgi:putative hydrolase of HD superfamily